MTMDKLADSLLSESRKEADKVLASARKEAEKLISEARNSEKVMLEEAEAEIKSRLDSQKKERLAWANMEKKRIISEAREEAVTSILEEMLVNLPRLRKHSSYGAFLRDKTRLALGELGDVQATIHVAKGDRKHLKSLTKKARIVEDLDGSGGVVVQNKPGTILVNYSLESIFELRKPELRKKIYTSFFGGRGRK